MKNAQICARHTAALEYSTAQICALFNVRFKNPHSPALNVTGKMEIGIRTWGEKLGASRPERRYVYIEYNLPLKKLTRILPLFKYNSFIRQPYYPDFEKYIRGFCKFCKEEEGIFIKCLRHETVVQIPFQLSNHEYSYDIILESPSLFLAEAHVGASGWEFKMKIAETKAEAVVKRPSGTTFTYRGEGERAFKISNPEEPTIWIPWYIGADPLYLKEPRSVYYVADDFIRHIAYLMQPFEIAEIANVYVITPHDEFLIPARPVKNE